MVLKIDIMDSLTLEEFRNIGFEPRQRFLTSVFQEILYKSALEFSQM